MTTLWPHQERALGSLRASLASGKRRPVVQAPTGSGKSLLASEIVLGALHKGKRAMFVVPALSLVDQILRMFWDEGIRDVGVIQADHYLTDFSKPVQVASVQTLQRRNVIPKVDVVIIDEVHRWFEFYGTWMKWEAWQNVPFIGLSATPWTKGLGLHFDNLIIPTTIQDLIDEKILSPFRVFAPSHPNLKGVKILAGDYHEGQLSKRMNTAPLIADAVDTWLKYADGLPTFCYGVDRAHAKSLQQQFQAAEVPCAYIDAFTPMEEREEIRKLFHAGEIKVVTNCEVLIFGIDWDVRCLQICRPTQSEMLHTQMIGRGLRRAEGKESLMILDHSDNHIRLGFVTDIFHDKLDDGTKGDTPDPTPGEGKPKECPKCHFVMTKKTYVCPNCGFKAEQKSKVEHEDGELIEITKKQRGKIQFENEAAFYGQLKFIERIKNKKRGFADALFKYKIGEWPNQHRNAPEFEPTPEVLKFVQSRMIAYAAQSRKAKNAA